MEKRAEQEAQRRWIREILTDPRYNGKPTRLADAAGVRPSTINRFLKGKNVTHSLSLSTLRSISKVSGKPIPLELYPRDAEPESNVDQSRRIQVPVRETLTSWIDVYGTAVCGEAQTGDFALNGQVVDRVRRPPALEGATGVFGIYVLGDSMEPRYENGDLVFIHPGRPVTVGSDVLVEMHAHEGDSHGAAYLKRLAKRTGGYLLLEQFNPPRQIKVPMKQVKHIYRVMRPVELFGV